MKTRIDVIRHGEPEGGRRYRGYSVDDPLTELGWQQMWSAIPEDAPWQHIISSPLSRCTDFSFALAEKLKIQVSIEDDVKEIGFGDWEGKTPEEIVATDSEAINHFYADPIHNRPNGAESLESFSDRVWNAYEHIASEFENKHVLIVAHAGVARAIAANILGMSLDNVYSRLRIEYGAIIKSVIETDKPPKLVIES